MNGQRQVDRVRESGRLERLRRELQRRGRSALVVRVASLDDPLVAPLVREVAGSGTLRAGRVGPCHLLFPADPGRPLALPESPWELGEAARSGFRVLDARRTGRSASAAVQALLDAAGAEAGSVAWSVETHVGPARRETPPEAAEAEDDDARDDDWNGFLRSLRRPRTATEVDEIGRVTGVVEHALVSIARMLLAAVEVDGHLWLEGAPLTVGRLRRDVGGRFLAHGLTQPEGNLLAPAEEAAEPHHPGTDERRLRPGDPLVVDLFPRGALFSDMTRTFVCGGRARTDADLASACAAVEQARGRVEERLLRQAESEGEVPCSVVQDLACEVLEDRGWETLRTSPDGDEGLVHGIGHGLGDELHEAPGFRVEDGDVLRPGDVFTLEPGLYRPGAWGVRWEDVFTLAPAPTEPGSGPRARLLRLGRLPFAPDPAEFLARAARAGVPER